MSGVNNPQDMQDVLDELATLLGFVDFPSAVRALQTERDELQRWVNTHQERKKAAERERDEAEAERDALRAQRDAAVEALAWALPLAQRYADGTKLRGRDLEMAKLAALLLVRGTP